MLIKIDRKSIQKNPNAGSMISLHSPEEKYLYKYEDPLIMCSECASKIKISEIEDISEDVDYYICDRCPVCKSIDSFEGREYENINDIVNEED